MVPVIENWNIFLAGLWNTAIFSPQWMAKELKELHDGSSMSVEFAASPRGVQLKFSTDRLVVTPEASSLIITTKTTEDESLRLAEALAERILETLPHTPVSAFGINFAFRDRELDQGLASLFRLSDAEGLAEHGHIPLSLSIKRSIKWEDAVLNVTLTASEEESLYVDLNFHHEVNDAKEASTRLNGRTLKYRDEGLAFLKNVYGLRMRETL
ncbi:MAG: hypothetical protein RDU20_02910 [Desulfomonilaceae bacterium]|nr:hypothetical protein [Desulfomonilaceae bacterium]